MGTFRSFEEIEAWQKARELTREIYEISNGVSFERILDFGNISERQPFRSCRILLKVSNATELQNSYNSFRSRKALSVRLEHNFMWRLIKNISMKKPLNDY